MVQQPGWMGGGRDTRQPGSQIQGQPAARQLRQGEGNMGFWSDVKDTLFGGGATRNVDTKLQQYDAATAQLGQMAQQAGGRVAPQMQAWQLAGGPQDQSRQGMTDVANRLGAIAGGQAPGAGELAVNRQIGQANAAQAAAAHMARGANAALAYRNAARNTADIGLAGAGQAAAAQMQDQQGANAQLGQLYGTMRGQDQAFAGQNAQLGQQAGLANQQAQLQQTGMNDARQIQALGQQLGWDQARINAELAKAGIASQDHGIFPSLLQAGGTVAAVLSDERLKTDITDGGNDADELMARLRPRTYRYRDPHNGEGRRLGIMAQDLARSRMGSATLVKVDSDGYLGVDIGKAASAALASVARLDERLRAVEGK